MTDRQLIERAQVLQARALAEYVLGLLADGYDGALLRPFEIWAALEQLDAAIVGQLRAVGLDGIRRLVAGIRQMDPERARELERQWEAVRLRVAHPENR